MSPFRGSDEVLDREIATLEGVAQRRVKRYARELRDLDKDLHELRKERARRRADAAIPETAQSTVSAEVDP